LTGPSLQEQYAPQSICFGCGPANDKGLRIRSFLDGGEVVLDWTPEPQHQAFPGMLNGGIIGALLDCHMNWTAAHHLMVRAVAETPPVTVTAEFSVKLKRPTPSDTPRIVVSTMPASATLTVLSTPTQMALP